MSRLENCENKFEYVEINNTYTGQIFSTFFSDNMKEIGCSFYRVRCAETENDKQNIVSSTDFM